MEIYNLNKEFKRVPFSQIETMWKLGVSAFLISDFVLQKKNITWMMMSLQLKPKT